MRLMTNADAIICLKNGGVVIMPTETSYGIVARADNPKAVERIFAIKGREEQKTLPLIASDLAMIERFAVVSDKIKELANKYWPGPLTVVLPFESDTPLASGVIDQNNHTIAIRVSSHFLPRSCAQYMECPLVSTSANVSGCPSIFSVEDLLNNWKDLDIRPDGYIDGGTLEESLPSTIIKEVDGAFDILRQGAVSIADGLLKKI